MGKTRNRHIKNSLPFPLEGPGAQVVQVDPGEWTIQIKNISLLGWGNPLVDKGFTFHGLEQLNYQNSELRAQRAEENCAGDNAVFTHERY